MCWSRAAPRARARPLHAAGRRGGGGRNAARGGRARDRGGDRHRDRAGRARRPPRGHHARRGGPGRAPFRDPAVSRRAGSPAKARRRSRSLSELRWLRPSGLAGLKTTRAWPTSSRRRSSGWKRSAILTGQLTRLALARIRRGISARCFASCAAFSSSHCPPTAAPSRQAARGRQRAPYESDLQRLSEILGALHYLRDLCGAARGRTGATRCRRWSTPRRRAASAASG